MTIYYHSGLQLWSDQLHDSPGTAAATRAKFAAWNQRSDPAAAYAAHGWQPVTESTPAYDDSPLIGSKARTIDEGGTTYSWTVGGVHWSDCVDDLAAARQRARDAIDLATSGAQQATIQYKLPAGATLDGEDADGQTVNLWMIHPAVETYWVDFRSMLQARGAFETEEFDSVEGRCTVPGAEMAAVFAVVATQGSLRRIAWRRIERAYATATTAEQFAGITAALTD